MALRDLCQQYGIRFKKQLGQNLLLDDNINRIMVESADLTAEDDVIEVGAGLGALTDRLYRQARRVLSIEIDRAFMPCLNDRFGEIENIRLFRGDVLNHTATKLIGEFLPGGTSYKVVANLPYYITTPILFHFWEDATPFARIVVMVQEEVALRMVAPVGGPNYGPLALATQLYGEASIVHKAPRTCFRPQPKVDSCIIMLRAWEAPLYPDLEKALVRRVVRTAFSQRRKTLRNSLTKSGGLGAPKEVVLEAMEAAGIEDGRRPQTLSLEEFAALTRAIKART